MLTHSMKVLLLNGAILDACQGPDWSRPFLLCQMMDDSIYGTVLQDPSARWVINSLFPSFCSLVFWSHLWSLQGDLQEILRTTEEAPQVCCISCAIWKYCTSSCLAMAHDNIAEDEHVGHRAFEIGMWMILSRLTPSPFLDAVCAILPVIDPSWSSRQSRWLLISCISEWQSCRSSLRFWVTSLWKWYLIHLCQALPTAVCVLFWQFVPLNACECMRQQSWPQGWQQCYIGLWSRQASWAMTPSE